MKTYQTRNILGIPVADVSLTTIGPVLKNILNKKNKQTIFGAYSTTINLYKTNKEFKEALDHATFIYPEGMGIVFASKLLGNPIQGKTALLDFIFFVFEYAAQKKWPIYILGGTKDVSKKAERNLKKRFPNLIVYTHHGYINSTQTKSIIADINRKKTKILFVSMGSPKQEIWIYNNMKRIQATFFLGIGGSIDVIANRIPRAPRLLIQCGLEWLYRVYKEPKRLSKRYFLGNIFFLFRVLSYRFH